MKHCDKKAVTINCTNKCNLCCEYCMASSSLEQANPITIVSAFAKKGIEDALTGHPTGIKATILRFFSPGEPTQKMAIIRECVELARAIDPQIKLELQTNGLFESYDDAKWIADTFNIVWFSLDGPPSVNDVHRPDANKIGRTKEIEANMGIVAARTNVGVRSTIVEETVYRQHELVEYYVNMGIRNMAFNPVIRPILRNDTGNVTVTKGAIMDFARGFIPAYKVAMKMNVTLFNSLTFNFDEPTEVSCRSCLPMPQLNPDGSVSSCDMALYSDTKKELSCFVYGRWDSESGTISYDMEKIRFLQNRRLDLLPKCKDCDIGKYCAGGCAGRVAYQTGNIYDVIPEYCAATKYLASYIKVGEQSLIHSHP